MGITRLNVYAGMAGFYMIRDSEEQSLGLPSGDYEIPLLFQDRSFYDDGQLFYPRGPGDILRIMNLAGKTRWWSALLKQHES